MYSMGTSIKWVRVFNGYVYSLHVTPDSVIISLVALIPS